MSNKLIRADLKKSFVPYHSARATAPDQGILLNANESPWDDEGHHFNRYPEPQPKVLLHSLAHRYGLSPEQILLTRGSDEGIDLLIRLFCQAGQDGILQLQPGFGMYAVYARLQNAVVATLSLSPETNFQCDAEAILDAVTPATKLIFLCSPQNPTGNSLSTDTINTVCSALTEKAMVVLDEAYIEFAPYESRLPLLARHDNLIILRTFSKAYGLAGVRFGTVLGSMEVVQWLRQIIAPYPLPSATTQAVAAVLKPEFEPILQQHVQSIRQQKKAFADFLATLPYVQRLWPSDANFILAAFDQAETIYQHCLAHGIIIRNFSRYPGLENCLRITIGTEADMQKLRSTLSALT